MQADSSITIIFVHFGILILHPFQQGQSFHKARQNYLMIYSHTKYMGLILQV